MARMVHLGKIYTKTGDDGSTGLGDGARLPKHHVRIAAYGTSDELSSTLGIASLQPGVEDDVARLLRSVQNDLFDVGADLCVPGTEGDKLRIDAGYVTRLEREIDARNADLEPLRSFVLPGGRPLAAWLHLARTVCRRAERLVSRLGEDEGDALNPEVLRYLNRLSDLLFVLARQANDGGRADVLWQPGLSKQGDA